MSDESTAHDLDVRSARIRFTELFGFTNDDARAAQVENDINLALEIYLRLEKAEFEQPKLPERRKTIKKLQVSLENAKPLLGGQQWFEAACNEIERIATDFPAVGQAGTRQGAYSMGCLIVRLAEIYEEQSGKDSRMTWNDVEERYTTGYFEFCRACIGILPLTSSARKKSPKSLGRQISRVLQNRDSYPAAIIDGSTS